MWSVWTSWAAIQWTSARAITAWLPWQDVQLGTRAQVVEILVFKANDTDFEGFLGDFACWCPLRRESDLPCDHSLRKALIRRTGGVTRYLIDVLIRLAVFCNLLCGGIYHLQIVQRVLQQSRI
ncbi:hypothetical protein DS901_06875 [Loktanella sp. D2R18]|nr:hypothetical protein DS901_06875 [Loktanella sp. D2R18]